MELKGTVRNVVDFGAFVDVGVHQDGLVHISKLANRFVKHPSDVVRIGDTVKVWVEKGRSRPQEDLAHHGTGQVNRQSKGTPCSDVQNREYSANSTVPDAPQRRKSMEQPPF